MRKSDRRLAAAAPASAGLRPAWRADTANIWVRADGSNFMPRIVDAFNKGA